MTHKERALSQFIGCLRAIWAKAGDVPLTGGGGLFYSTGSSSIVISVRRRGCRWVCEASILGIPASKWRLDEQGRHDLHEYWIEVFSRLAGAATALGID